MLKSDRDFYIWLSGLIDGDGCFTISLRKQHNSKTPSLSVWSQVCITSRADRRWYLDEIAKRVGFGKVYEKQQKDYYPITTYQTTNYKDSLELAKRLYPYLQVKKKKAELFIKAIDYWNSTRGIVKGNVARGERLRTASDVLKMVKISLEINADRQTRRYKNKLTYKQWVPLIKEWYPK